VEKRLAAWRRQMLGLAARFSKRMPPPLQRLSRTLSSVLGAQVGALLVLDMLVALAVGTVSPVFFTRANVVAMGVAMSGNVLAAMGAVLVLLSGGFDLSVGSSYGLGGVIAALAVKNGIPVWPSLALGVLTGTLIGLINGLIITKVEINPFIATMGTMTMGRALVNVITRGYAVSGLPPAFMKLVSAKILGLPPSFVIMLLVFVLTDLALRFWRPVRQLYYIGGSAPYARLVGINVTRAQTLAYMFAGTMAGLGGVLFTMRTGAGSQQAGSGIEMMAIVAGFLGGVGFGGEGSALGAFLGALLIALVVNAIQLLGIATLWQNVVIGTFLIIASLVGMARFQQATQRIRKERRNEAEEA
jgi:ribose transport system permease protein